MSVLIYSVEEFYQFSNNYTEYQITSYESFIGKVMALIWENISNAQC